MTQRKVGVYPALKEWESCMYWKKKTGATLQLGLFGFLFKIWLFKLGAKGLFWRILHGLRDWHQNLTFIWCTALSVSKWFSLEEMYPENVKKKTHSSSKMHRRVKERVFQSVKNKTGKRKESKKKIKQAQVTVYLFKNVFSISQSAVIKLSSVFTFTLVFVSNVRNNDI